MAWTRRWREIRSVPLVSRTSVMGTVVCQEIYGINGALAAERAGRELHRLDTLWSPYQPGNVVAAIRRAAGNGPVPADPDTVKVLKAARSLGLTSGGALDITADPLIRLWREAALKKVPPFPEDIEKGTALTNIEALQPTAATRRWLRLCVRTHFYESWKRK